MLFNLDMPFRVQEMFFGGILFNTMITVSLAFAPANRKLLFEKLSKYGSEPTWSDFYLPLTYSSGTAVICLMSFAVTKSNFAALITLTGSLILYAVTNISKKTALPATMLKNKNLLISAVVIAAVLAALMKIALLRDMFGYTEISALNAALATLLPFVYFLTVQSVKYILEKQRRKRSISHGEIY